MSLAAGTRLGPYEIVRAIGAGGMGEVFRARDTRIGRDVAIKILPPEVAQTRDRLRRFEDEARAAGMLQHPNLLTVFDVGTEPMPYIVSELLEGETLRARIVRGPIPVPKAIEWAIGIATGLAAAHEKKITHRDLKPENIFLTQDGHVKILDFGLAKLMTGEAETDGSAGATAERLTEPGTILGTAGYMSPEQVRGSAVDHRSDIFSFGTILYEMLSGRRAFGGPSRADAMSAILREDPPPLDNSKAPPPLETIVRHCLEKEAHARFQSARDIAFNLEMAAGQGVATPRSGSARSAIWLVLLPLLALAAGVAIGFFMQRPAAPPAPVPPSLQLLTYSGRDGAPAMAPDGRTMAFTSSRDGRLRIWVRDLARGGEVPLTDGEDGWPRFSPDGTSILFLRRTGQQRALWMTALLGGTPRRIRDDVTAADWSNDGRRIVLTSTPTANRTALASVNIDGTGETPIRELAGIYVAPRVSPNGKQIALTEFASSSLDTSIIIVTADGKEERKLPLGDHATPGLSAVSWIDDDRLIFGAFTAATPFSSAGSDIVEINVVTGALRPRLHAPATVWTTENAGADRIVFDTVAIRQNLREITAGGSPGGRWLTRGSAVARQPVYSPDGRHLLFSSNQGGNLDVWSISIEEGALTRLTDDPADDYDPAWSPDGRQVIWTSNRGGHFEIWMSNADGSSPRQVSRDGADAENATPTPDGWLIYNSYHPQKSGIWRVRTDGSRAGQIVRGVTENPEVSPDGRYVSYHLISPRSELRVVRIEDGQSFTIADVRGRIGQATLGAGRSRWTPAGDAVAWTDLNESNAWGVFMQKFAPGSDTSATRKTLAGFGPDEQVESFAFSPDGKRITVSVLEEVEAIYMAR